MKKQIVTEEKIQNAVIFLRGKRLIMDSDLAAFYGVSTKAFNQAVKRNADRFPVDFMFRLTEEEWKSLRSQNVTLKKRRGAHKKYLPSAFTEHGAVMAAYLLNSPFAIQASIQIVRAFIHITEVLTIHKELANKIDTLEKKLNGRFRKQGKEIKLLFSALHQLLQQKNTPRKKVGFNYDMKNKSN